MYLVSTATTMRCDNPNGECVACSKGLQSQRDCQYFKESNLHSLLPLVTDNLITRLFKAARDWPYWTSYHAGENLIREELEELRKEVFERHQDPSRMVEEAFDIMVTAARFICDLCPEALIALSEKQNAEIVGSELCDPGSSNGE